MIHKITDVLDLEDDNSSGAGLGAASYSAAAHTGTGIDMTLYEGGAAFFVSCDTVGSSGTIDCKVQDSADNSSFADVTGLAITQLTAAGNAVINFRTRQVRRYVHVVLTIGVAASVVAVIFVGQKRTL